MIFSSILNQLLQILCRISADTHKTMIDNINEINSNIANCTNTEFTLIQEYDNNKNEVTHGKMDYFNIVNEPKKE